MKKIIIFITIIIVVSAALFSVYSIFFRKAGKSGQISIRQGEGKREIGISLKSEGLISSPLFFYAYVYLRHDVLQSGVYKIDSEMSIPQMVALIKEGKVQEYLVTIPEGWRLTQIDEYLAEKKIIKPGDLIKISSADEGYLFPDTYRFPLDIKPQEVREMMIENFNKKTSQYNINSQTIILASIVEREAKFDEDRPKIAGVYLNRLEQNMKLEADPTVQYAKGSWDPITAADYKSVISPYNTYLYAGLPPGPICNPGLKSIEAVLYPQKDGYLYFFHKEDGHAVYSKTQEEHEANLKNN